MARKPAGGLASDPELLILTGLINGPKHGYALMEDIEVNAGVTLGPGTLYGAITRLVDNGWIEPVEPAGRQRPYRLTGAGAAYLREQLERLQDLVARGLRRLRTA